MCLSSPLFLSFPLWSPSLVEFQVVHPEALGSFVAQASAFATAGVVVLVHGAAVANLVFLPAGAAVIELKQYAGFPHS